MNHRQVIECVSLFWLGWVATRPVRDWLVRYPGRLPFDRK